MIIKQTSILLAALSAVSILGGCAVNTANTAGLGTDDGRVASNPGGISPQQVYAPPEFKEVVWWNIGSFEAVPAEQAEAGKAFCGKQDTDKVEYVATGYHRYARQTTSAPFEGGGFYCVAREKPEPAKTASAEQAAAEK
jgi:hypothetical protein